ncbi:putative bifunctional diguanylate cyclase/phosphodiesterase [Clostridium taeniosporum]|uniref:Bifunctional diguanylate cyclase/phosphodiesterase n=1 Tax=Clostridium taeniosporum TaxID=394958 RepID=A0A1D7XK49_9CLOT|nr:bifunctional diguanylate cyclase/phosphodiesterase [Clostridium taeniosporum]AOR23704.1 bifunctional diguanylate cyclase/phosphodiesterase [Clostridium taeniosporum]
MKIVRKILIMMIIVTFMTILLNSLFSNITMKELFDCEVEKSSGKTSAAVERLEEEIEQFRDSTINLSHWIKIFEDFNREGFKEELQKNNKIFNNINSNIYLLDKNFDISDIIRKKYEYNNKSEFYEIVNVVKGELDKQENKNVFSGIVSNKDGKYIAICKEIIYSNSSSQYLLVVENLDKKVYKDLKDFFGTILIHTLNDEDFSDYESIQKHGRVCYVKYTKDSVISYIQLDTYGKGEKLYLSLIEKPKVVNRIRHNINILLILIVMVTTIMNIIIYILIKKIVVNRILKLNNWVTEIVKTFNLNNRINENIFCKDEISSLATDLNNMLDVLKNYSNNMKYIAEHDQLTNLLNRRSIEKIGQEYISNNEEFALAFIDLDNFKMINDSLGHDVGDSILCTTAEFLNEYINEDVDIGRLGGDEFIIILKGNKKKDRIIEICENLLEKINIEYKFKNFKFTSKASIGISFFPENGDGMVNILKYADISMYNAKKNGGNSYCIFNDSLLNSFKLESSIKKGLVNNEFEAYFQPIYHIKSKKIIGAEALARWKSKNGVILPGKFLPIVKKTGDILEIDRIMIKESCKLVKKFIDKGLDDFQVSINVSLSLLKQDTFLDEILENINKYNIKPKNLKIEITEDEIINDISYMIELLSNIRNVGIHISLDDFGTGYSSFNYLKRLPLDVIKIDRSLILNLSNDDKTVEIIETIIKLAHILNLNVICEGIETETQLEFLKSLKCDCIQGYYISKPLCKDEFSLFYDEFLNK